MINLSLILLILSGTFYAAAFVSHAVSFMGDRQTALRPAFALMKIGFLFSTFYFAAEAIEHGFFLPVVSFPQAMSFFAWSLGFIYFVLLVRVQSESFGLILTPILLLLTAAAIFGRLHLAGLEAPPKPYLLNPYFTVHIVTAFFAYACFTLSFAAGILFLIQHHELKHKHAGRFYHKLPSLEELERLVYQPLIWGAPLLAAALGIGFFWSKWAFGKYWIFDPKTIATTVTSALYFIILYLRFGSSIRGKQGAILCVLAFGVVIFSFVGIRFIGTSHQFTH